MFLQVEGLRMCGSVAMLYSGLWLCYTVKFKLPGFKDHLSKIRQTYQDFRRKTVGYCNLSTREPYDLMMDRFQPCQSSLG